MTASTGRRRFLGFLAAMVIGPTALVPRRAKAAFAAQDLTIHSGQVVNLSGAAVFGTVTLYPNGRINLAGDNASFTAQQLIRRG